MDGEPASDTVAPAPLTPRAVLDAGGEMWAALSDGINRLFGDMAAGAILEVIAAEPGTEADLLAWCGATGHEVFRRWDEDTSTRFWIKKADGAPGDRA